MYGINDKLAKREEDGRPIIVGVIGAGQMGRGMICQASLIKGMKIGVVADLNTEVAVKALKSSGMSDDDFRITNTLSEANDILAQGKTVVTEDFSIGVAMDKVDAIVDITGVPNVAARVAYDSIMNHKHVVLLTVETDVVVGPILNKLAKKCGVVYTVSAGDEPGVVKGLYDFAIASGYRVLSAGKSPNNVLDFTCTPDTVREEALRRGMNPKMLCSFKDNTKTMVELTCISNATGLVPDVPGCHGGTADVYTPERVKPFLDLLRLKEEGGILNQYGVVEYINGMAPGVFVTYTVDNPEVRAELKYLSQGDGPNYILWRPYHLTSLETLHSVAMAVLENKPTIVPMDGFVSETCCMAKTDLKAGSHLDGGGGYTVRGWMMKHEDAVKSRALPLGLVSPKAKLLQDVKCGDLITYDMVELEEGAFINRLRALQDLLF
ncbi:NAD(P)H-dependent oxidoreductase [Dysosmobacter sp. Phy]